MSFTTPELVAIRIAQLEAEASAERLVRVTRVTAWAQNARRLQAGAGGRPRLIETRLQLRAPRL